MSSLLHKIENKLGMNTATTHTNTTSTPGSSMTGSSSLDRSAASTGTTGSNLSGDHTVTQTPLVGSSAASSDVTGASATGTGLGLAGHGYGKQFGDRVGAEVDTIGAKHGMATGAGSLGTKVAAQVATAGEAVLTRAEERLVVGKETVQAGVAQLHKYVTKEHVGTAVPVVKERAVIEREAITDGEIGAGVGANAFQEQHVAVALRDEIAVGRKEEVPIERVRLRKEQEIAHETVEADLRKEHIEVTEASGMLPGAGRNSTGLATEKRLGDAPLATNSAATDIATSDRRNL